MGSRGSRYGEDERRRRRNEETTAGDVQDNTPAVSNALTEERMNNAFNAKSAKEADAKLLPATQQVWDNLTDPEKIVVRSYSGKLAGELNTYLWSGKEQHGGYDNITDTYYEGDVQQPLDLLTNALNKSELQQDTWLERGIDKKDLLTMLGISDVSQIDSLITNGDLKQHKGFMSTTSGDINSSYAKFQPVLLKVFAPKGTKGMYINPVSKFGDGLLKIGSDTVAKYPSGTKQVSKIVKDWDKKTSHASGSEIETILQRGLNFKVIGQETSNSGNLTVTIAIVN